MLVYQPPGAEPDVDAMELEPYTKADICDDIRAQYNIPQAWCAMALSAYDAIERKAKIQDHAGRNDVGRTFNPCFDWKKKDIVETVRAAGLKLPKDYLMAARTFNGVPCYRNLVRLEEVCLEDWQRVKLCFPMIEAELARQHFRNLKFPDTPHRTKQARCESRAGDTACPDPQNRAGPESPVGPQRHEQSLTELRASQWLSSGPTDHPVECRTPTPHPSA
jgi:hypothetical protein